MSFLHPWALALGIAAVAAPLVVHWLTRPRPMRMPLSTIRFVRQAVHQKRARYRLRDFLILLLRAAAVILLGWAFARPLTGAKPLVTTSSTGDTIRIVLLDSSLSMSAVSGGQPAFDRGRAKAAEFLQYQSGLRADLLLSAAKASPAFDFASSNLSAMRDALSSASAMPQRIDVQAAINRAAEIINKSPHTHTTRLELVVISDFQRTSWASADFSPLPKDAVIQFQSVAPKETPGNLAILQVGATGRIEQGREVKLEAVVGNYSKTPREVQVDIAMGEVTCRLSGNCPPGMKTALNGSVQLKTAGWIWGNATLVGVEDALAMDNTRPVVLDVRPPPTYGLITREPSRPHFSSSHLMERALVPVTPQEGRPGEHVIRVDPAQLDRNALVTSNLLIIDHPGPLSADSINVIAGLVRRGKPMLYVCGEPTDATNLKLFADAAGTDLKMPVEFQPPPANQPRQDLFLLEWKKEQQPFASLNETLTAVAGSLRFAGGCASRRLEGGLQDDVLASYSDRSAALVVTACGAGNLAVLNVDLPSSSLPSSPAFVPLVGELAARLLASDRTPDASACGEPLAAYITGETSPANLAVFAPDGKKLDDAITQEGQFVLWRSEAAGAPGVYSVRRGNQIALAVATAAPGSESDLEPLDPETLKTRLAAGHRADYQGSGDEPAKDSAWAWILVACCGCLLSELCVLHAFRT